MVEFCGGVLPSNEEEFETVDYWDRFFATERGAAFEWYVDAKSAADVAVSVLGEGELVINLGCGTCNLPTELALRRPGTAILSVDNCVGAVEALRKLSADNELLTFAVDDAFTLASVTTPAHLVLDKGLVDALHCKDDTSHRASIAKLSTTVARVLDPTGGFVVISLLQPHIRRLLESALDGPLWTRKCVAPLAVKDGKTFQPFAIFASKDPDAGSGVFWAGSHAELLNGGSLCSWTELWARVERQCEELLKVKKKKRRLVSAELHFKLRGKHLGKPAAQILADKIHASLPLVKGFLSWRSPPELSPLAFGLFFVKTTVLADAELTEPEQLRDDLSTTLGCVADDSDDDSDTESTSTNEDEEQEEAPTPESIRVAIPEIAHLEWGEAA